MALGPHTITRLRATAAVDPYSNLSTAIDWTNPSSLTLPGCSVQPAAGTEFREPGRDAVTTALTVWVPFDSDVQALDRIRYAGVDYEVDGAVQPWDFGSLAHKVVNLKVVSG